jgi:hypothetical protein
MEIGNQISNPIRNSNICNNRQKKGVCILIYLAIVEENSDFGFASFSFHQNPDKLIEIPNYVINFQNFYIVLSFVIAFFEIIYHVYELISQNDHLIYIFHGFTNVMFTYKCKLPFT